MFEEALRLVGFGLCHQIPERSFFGGGLQVPVCARDTGIYVGFAIAIFILGLLDRGRRSSELPPAWMLALLGIGVVLMGVDGVSSYAGWRETTNEIRLATGLMTGFAIAGLAMPMLNGQLWARPGAGRLLGARGDALGFLAALPASYALVWWLAPRTGVAYPVLTAAAIIFTFTYVNALIVALLPVFERRAKSCASTVPVFAIAFALALLEMAGSVALKEWLVRLSGVVL